MKKYEMGPDRKLREVVSESRLGGDWPAWVIVLILAAAGFVSTVVWAGVILLALKLLLLLGWV